MKIRLCARRTCITLSPVIHDDGKNQAWQEHLTFSKYVSRLIELDLIRRGKTSGRKPTQTK